MYYYTLYRNIHTTHDALEGDRELNGIVYPKRIAKTQHKRYDIMELQDSKYHQNVHQNLDIDAIYLDFIDRTVKVDKK